MPKMDKDCPTVGGEIMIKVASVIVDNAARETDKPFEYLIPEELQALVKIGMRVVVPFGKGNKYIEGYLIDIKDNSDYDIKKLKAIGDVIDDTLYFDDEMLKLAYFLKERYNATLSESFNAILPSGIKFKEKLFIKLNPSYSNILGEKYKKVISGLNEDKFVEFNDLKKQIGGNLQRSVLFGMERVGVVEIKRDIIQNTKIKNLEVYIPGEYDVCQDFITEFEKKRKKQVEILKVMISEEQELTLGQIVEKYECSPGVVKSLYEAGVLIKKEIEVFRNPSEREYKYGRVELTEDQQLAIESILNSYKKGRSVSLIRGVTGSGKTEIYLNLVERCINKGCGAIVMVPEISLTPQTLERFKGRFGNTVAILHSRLSNGERYDEWRRIKSGDVKVVVGARSAVFAPVLNLKLIIIDEEHEYSYKSDSSPKYHTVEVASFRVNQNKGLLVLGSATPSLESYYKALNGEYNLVTINKRVMDIKMPEVKIVDMREELKGGNKSIFSTALQDEIGINLERGEQTILFLNRRGHSTFISCRECGYVCKCSNCDVSLTYHISTNKLVCHYCGSEHKSPSICPKCGSKYIKYFGTGTEKIEMEIKRLFPEARTLRMDMDTTRKKGQHERIYEDFKNHKADILIGTQMISKGMDFKGVTLVGIIAADMTLNLPDFRAPERTFQLITQVSGRAGRGELKGRVIVQTYDSEHYSIEYASNGDYIGFYEKEILYRKMLNNPPFTDILYVLLASENEETLIKNSMALRDKISGSINLKNIEMLGPAPCHVGKIKNIYRWHMIFKGDVYSYIRDISDIIYKSIDGNISCSIDINPYNMG